MRNYCPICGETWYENSGCMCMWGSHEYCEECGKRLNKNGKCSCQELRPVKKQIMHFCLGTNRAVEIQDDWSMCPYCGEKFTMENGKVKLVKRKMTEDEETEYHKMMWEKIRKFEGR